MSNEKKFPAYICIFSQINRQAMIPTHLILTFAKKKTTCFKQKECKYTSTKNVMQTNCRIFVIFSIV